MKGQKILKVTSILMIIGGITAAIFFGFLVALLFKSKPKS